MVRLVVTPPPLRTESLLGYVLHLTAANRYPGSKFILASMRKRKDQSSVGRLDSSPLISLAGLNKEQATRLSMRCPAKNNRGSIGLVGQAISRYQLRLNKPKVCPACLVENQRCQAFWDLSLVTICPTHAVRMLEQCRICKNPLRWHRARTYLCQCGADLRKQGSKRKVPVEWTTLVSAICSSLYLDEVNYPFPDELIAFKNLSIQQLLSLIDRLCFEIDWLEGGNTSARGSHQVRDYVPEVAKALYNWPTNFQTFLSRRYGKQLKGNGDLPVFRNLFSWVPRMRNKALTDIDPEMRMVANEVFRFGAHYWSQVLMTKNRGERGISIEQCQWGTAADVIKITGNHQEVIRRGMDIGEIPTRFALTSRSRRVELVSLVWAREFAAQIDHSPRLRVKDAARHVGIPADTLRQLRAKGYFKLPPPHMKMHYGFFVHELDALKSSLLAKQLPIALLKNRQSVGLGILLNYGNCDTTSKVKLVEHILIGKLKIYGNETKLRDAKVEVRAVKPYWHSRVYRYMDG